MGGFFSHIFHVVGWCDSLYYLFPFFFINLHVFARILLSLLIPMATVTFTFTTFSLPFLLLKIARCVSRRMFVCEKQQQDERRRKKMHIAFPFGIQHSSSKQMLAIFFFRSFASYQLNWQRQAVCLFHPLCFDVPPPPSLLCLALCVAILPLPLSFGACACFGRDCMSSLNQHNIKLESTFSIHFFPYMSRLMFMDTYTIILRVPFFHDFLVHSEFFFSRINIFHLSSISMNEPNYVNNFLFIYNNYNGLCWGFVFGFFLQNPAENASYSFCQCYCVLRSIWVSVFFDDS